MPGGSGEKAPGDVECEQHVVRQVVERETELLSLIEELPAELGSQGVVVDRACLPPQVERVLVVGRGNECIA